MPGQRLQGQDSERIEAEIDDMEHRPMGAVTYVVLLVGAIGVAIGLYYALRTVKLI